MRLKSACSLWNTLSLMKLSHFITDHFLIILVAVIWQKYYRFCVKHLTINSPTLWNDQLKKLWRNEYIEWIWNLILIFSLNLHSERALVVRQFHNSAFRYFDTPTLQQFDRKKLNVPIFHPPTRETKMKILRFNALSCS